MRMGVMSAQAEHADAQPFTAAKCEHGDPPTVMFDQAAGKMVYCNDGIWVPMSGKSLRRMAATVEYQDRMHRPTRDTLYASRASCIPVAICAAK